MVAKLGAVGEGWSGSLQLAGANYYIENGLKNKVLLYGTGNYIQYPVINCNGKKYEEECICMCVCVCVCVYN